MLIEILSNLVSLNISYFIHLVMNNLFWLFGFAAVSYYFRGKNFCLRFFTTVFMVYGMLDMQKVHNLYYFVGGALIILYLSRMAVLTAVAKTKGAEKYLPLFYSLISYSVLFYFNFFGG